MQKKLPPGVEIHPFYDRSNLIHRAIGTVEHNLIEGALLVVIVLLLMLGNLRAGLIVAAVIPVSMMMAFVGMRAFGIPGNLMSLGAIDFGLIVDGAVVLVENVLRRQSAADENDREPAKVVPGAAAEVARSVMFAVIIITMIYVPIMSLQSVEGKTFRPMALTVMLALGSSLLVTMLAIPALAATFLSRKPSKGDTFVVRWARKAYTPVLRRTEKHPYITVGFAAALFVGALFLASGLGGEFIPILQEGAIVVTSNKLPSINLDASIRTVTEIEKVIRTFPEVQTVVSQTGSAAVPTDPMGVQSTDSYVILKPPGQWKTLHTQKAILAAIEKKVKAEVPGISWEFSQPIQMRMNDLLQGVRSQIALTIYGHDLHELRTLADKAVRIVQGIKGAADVRSEQEGGLPDLTVQVNRGRLARYGINASDVLAVIAAIGGRTVGTVYGPNDTETPIVVRLPQSDRSSAERVRNIPVGLADGQSVPLSEVADVTVAPGPAQVERDKLQRRIAVQINVRGSDVNSFATEAEKQIAQKLHLPTGYSVEWGGEFQNLRSATARLSLVMPVVLAVIFLLLYLNFGSLRLSALDLPQRADGGDRRDRRPRAAGDAVQRHGRDRLHLGLRRRDPRWRGARRLHRGGARGGQEPGGRGARGGGEAAAPGADDGARRLDRLLPDGALDERRLRGAAPARHRGHRRPGHGDAAHAAGVAVALSRGGEGQAAVLEDGEGLGPARAGAPSRGVTGKDSLDLL